MYAHMWHGLAHSLMDFVTHAHFPGTSEAIYVVAYIKKASPISEKKNYIGSTEPQLYITIACTHTNILVERSYTRRIKLKLLRKVSSLKTAAAQQRHHTRRIRNIAKKKHPLKQTRSNFDGKS